MPKRSTVRDRARTVGWRVARDASRLVRSLNARSRPLPDFLIIGTQRGGTTSLADKLWSHPAVLGPAVSKGVHYFDTRYHHGDTWYRSHFPSSRTRAATAIRSGAPTALVGEASPYYLFHPAVPARVNALIPGVKLLVVLRNPVDRAVSHHKHEVRRGFENLAFVEAIACEEERLAGEEERLLADPSYVSFEHQHHSYVARGLYAEQLERWLEHFPREQLLVVSSEQLFRDPRLVIARVEGFLGLSPHSDGELPVLNATHGGNIAAEARARLQERFAPANERLTQLLGEDFGWDH